MEGPGESATDREVGRAADPVATALEAAVERFRAMVRSAGMRYHLSPDDLEDLVQEVRIRLWRACPAGERMQGLGASYVYRTARSAVLDIIRRRRAFEAGNTESVQDHSDRLATTARGADAELEADELVAHIRAAVDALPDARRTAVRLYLSGYAPAEITSLLGWSEARTRNLLYRGLADLRARLRAQGIDPAGGAS